MLACQLLMFDIFSPSHFSSWNQPTKEGGKETPLKKSPPRDSLEGSPSKEYLFPNFAMLRILESRNVTYAPVVEWAILNTKRLQQLEACRRETLRDARKWDGLRPLSPIWERRAGWEEAGEGCPVEARLLPPFRTVAEQCPDNQTFWKVIKRLPLE